MRRIGILFGAILAMAGLGAAPGIAQTGNGAPSGPHYNLNIIGHDQCPGDDLKGTNRHVIDVLLNFNDGSQNGQLASSLDKRNKIFLSEGPFQVLDGNACDGDGASFQLAGNPFTCPTDDPSCLTTEPTFAKYTVWVRALGSPKNNPSASINTCATDAGPDLTFGTADDVLVCSTESVVLIRNTGKSKFDNVTQELTTLCLDTNADGKCDTRVGIFDSSLQGFLWDYDNNGLRLAQLRFYPVLN